MAVMLVMQRSVCGMWQPPRRESPWITPCEDKGFLYLRWRFPRMETTLASGFLLGVRLWDVATERTKKILEGDVFWVLSLAFSPDGSTLAGDSGLFDGTIRLWDVDTGQEKVTLAGHANPVSSVAFSPDGQALASGSYDGTILLWDVESGQEKAVLQGHTDGVSSVAFSPDGQALASGSYDGTILLWDMTPYVTPSIATTIAAASPSLPVKTAPAAQLPQPLQPPTPISPFNCTSRPRCA